MFHFFYLNSKIVRFHGIGLQEHRVLSTSYQVIEYMKGGSMKNLIMLQNIQRQQGQTISLYSDKDALRWCLDIAEALEYLHTFEIPIVHRDIKLDNILLSTTQTSIAEAKLSDFGLARYSICHKHIVVFNIKSFG